MRTSTNHYQFQKLTPIKNADIKFIRTLLILLSMRKTLEILLYLNLSTKKIRYFLFTLMHGNINLPEKIRENIIQNAISALKNDGN
ncbi:hypothetical protein SD70_03450 [Gordoniibacillus kamchatkensis]|uniref:Uncharacterized protein n=1 Tax=Gordoniibacillus kamchatkensis TaxID=1590651 RepID=A0ABR5ALP1_9BACL|nr:hypothetical protein SD70_03450 [Paenibacillus sp. VKM B-2647]